VLRDTKHHDHERQGIVDSRRLHASQTTDRRRVKADLLMPSHCRIVFCRLPCKHTDDLCPRQCASFPRSLSALVANDRQRCRPPPSLLREPLSSSHWASAFHLQLPCCTGNPARPQLQPMRSPRGACADTRRASTHLSMLSFSGQQH